MRTDGRIRFTGQIDADDTGIGNVIGIFEKLFNQFPAAFANSHRPQGTITGMAVGADDHIAAAGHFSRIYW